MHYNFGNGFTNNDENFGILDVFEIENVNNKYEYLVKQFYKQTKNWIT